MIDINVIRKEKEKVRTELKKRNLRPGLVDDVLDVDKERRDLLVKIEELRSKQNSFNKEINSFEGSEKQRKLLEMKAISERVKELEVPLTELEGRYIELMYQIPNLSHPSVPVGSDEMGNVVEKEWGEPKEFTFEPKNHLELALLHDLIDMDRGAKVSGARFYYTKKDLVKLEFALVQYLFDLLTKKEFIPLSVPLLVNESAMYGTGFFPAEKNEVYSVNPNEDNKYLIGTSEVSIASYHADEILELDSLPKKYMAYSPCFRREAGSYGKDTTGIFRVHQFNKVEMFAITTEENSWNVFDELISNTEEILQRLELPYRKVNMCTGDISPQTAKKYDLEAWIPSQNCYRELVSGTNTTSYQSRRLNIRYKDATGKKHFAHMLNCTAGGSMTRLFVAILENYQQEDGSVLIPEVLRPYLGGQEKIG